MERDAEKEKSVAPAARTKQASHGGTRPPLTAFAWVNIAAESKFQTYSYYC